MPDVAGSCPACGAASLFLGEGGHVTCARIDCPDPGAADNMLGQGALMLHRVAVLASELFTAGTPGPERETARKFLAALQRKEPRLLDCGFCYEEQGEEVHPHPECPIGSDARQQPPVVATARIHMDVTTPATANLPEFERAQAVARAERAEATIRRVRDASAYIRATTRTWDPVADIIDAALDEDGDPVHARVALAVRTVLNQNLPGDMGGHVATAVLAALRKERPDA
ncbi:DUF6085 family protein [Streptomyces microflavus]|uniref:DUF6085 family protein n=1 Tax=Streptomyces microflavus TaxID=1919 RepID=UPI002E37B38E|nr:DUF6085 family protein [Streptomyces microflavus]